VRCGSAARARSGCAAYSAVGGAALLTSTQSSHESVEQQAEHEGAVWLAFGHERERRGAEALATTDFRRQPNAAAADLAWRRPPWWAPVVSAQSACVGLAQPEPCAAHVEATRTWRGCFWLHLATRSGASRYARAFIGSGRGSCCPPC
jgi:hypothetical protein